MKFLVLALCMCAANAAVYSPKSVAQAAASPFIAAANAVAAAPGAAAKFVTGSDAGATVVNQNSDVHAEGFQYGYQTSNGIAGEASGQLKKVDNVDVLAVQGTYTYTAPDGTAVKFAYTADENGYQPQSDQLPVGPEVPAYIVQSLKYIADHPAYVEPPQKKF